MEIERQARGTQRREANLLPFSNIEAMLIATAKTNKSAANVIKRGEFVQKKVANLFYVLRFAMQFSFQFTFSLSQTELDTELNSFCSSNRKRTPI
jgi:hypothetical protein